jgi:hypothetical protein
MSARHHPESASASRTQACDCVEPQWSVRLRDVTSTDPSVTHRPYWGEMGTLYVDGLGTRLSLPGTNDDVLTAGILSWLP